ncbi:aminotransferase class IV [bacterium]|nr:aminotransferase class IV [bacterium]
MKGLIETFLQVRHPAPFFEASWKRLTRSAKKTGIQISPDLKRRTIAWLRLLPARPWRVRLVLKPDGSMIHEFRRMTQPRTRKVNKSIPGTRVGGTRGGAWAAGFPACHLAAMAAPCGYPGNWPGLKTIDRRGLDRSYDRARRAGADDALLVLAGRRIAETSRANIFWIQNGVIHTPPLGTGCLPGLTRAWVLKTCRKIGLAVREKDGALEDIGNSEGAFRTNAVIGIEWVRRLSGLKRKTWRKPHPAVIRLHRIYRKLFRHPGGQRKGRPPRTWT